MSEKRILAKKPCLSTFCIKKIGDNAPETQNFVKISHLMFQSILQSLKSIGTYLVVKLRLIRKLKKSKFSSKTIKNLFLENQAIYVLADYSVCIDTRSCPAKFGTPRPFGSAVIGMYTKVAL